jgi:hypothetical protein
MTALSAAGLSNNWPLVLFGENAALPHGSGSDRALGERDFALIDCGGDLHGYGSDVTRVSCMLALAQYLADMHSPDIRSEELEDTRGSSGHMEARTLSTSSWLRKGS